MQIRREQANDAECIRNIQYAAFKGHPMHEPGAEPVEHLIVERLRQAGALSVSLLAEEKETVGHIAVSPACVGDAQQGWYLLGPVGVFPEQQRRGIGTALVREALERMRASGAAGVVLVGDPAFYGRFGFASLPGLSYEGVPDEYVLGLRFGEAAPSGAIVAHEAFRV